MIKCEHPIQLRSGLVVPCGHCLLCLSKRRDEWSHRLQLHSYGYDKMPLFVTLTYDDEHLKFGNSSTLYPRDLRLFIKRIKENFKLYDTDFTYFGCGEYGDERFTHRPHYHILFFGFDELSDLFDRDWLGAHQLLRSQWIQGNVDIGRAQWSGVHYVTKYVLKYDDEQYIDQSPFLVASHGIGLPWLKTPEAVFLKSRLEHLFRSKPALPLLSLDSGYSDFIASCRLARNEIMAYYPRLVAHTPQGVEVPLPRYIRDKLIGHFELFKDNPYWFLDLLNKEIDSYEYCQNNLQYDFRSDVPMWQQRIDKIKHKINQRMYLNSKHFRNETIRIGSHPQTCL